MALEERLHLNYDEPGKEVASIYPTGELIDRLRNYNTKDALVSFDIAGCLKKSPEFTIVWKSIPKIWRWIGHPEWLYDFTLTMIAARREGWSMEEIESFSIRYAEQKVLPHFTNEFKLQVARKEAPPFYPGVQETVDFLKGSNRIVVSRGFREIVQVTIDQLGIERGYYRIDDKGTKILDYAQEIGAKRVLIFGDLQVDVNAANEIRDSGLQTDLVMVNKKFNPKYFNENATIFIPRNWEGLYRLMSNT